MIKVEAVWPSKGTQNWLILRYLVKNPYITGMQALNVAHCWSLPKRICELQEMGWEFEKGWVKTSGGARVRSYRLA